LAYFLVKTEPTDYSFDDLMHDGRTIWNGVTNRLALINLRAMKKNDQVFIYHSGKEKSVVGIASVGGSSDSDKGPVVELKAVRALDLKVSLSEIKSRKEFRNFDLVRNSRLSVMKVPDDLWEKILKLSGGG